MRLFKTIKRSVGWSLFLCLTVSLSNAQNFDWARSIGGLGLDVGRAVTTDADGNVILVGSFSGSTQIAGTTLSGLGGMESFVAKYTSDGNLLWAQVISGPDEDMARGVVTDQSGNIYVVGHFTDTVVFAITPTDTIAARSTGGQDVFVVKYSPDGTLLWKVTGGGTGDDTATDIDQYRWSGKLFVSGGFQERGKFGSSTVLSSGLTDAFLLKLDPDGNVHWVRSGGGLEHDIAATVAAGNDGSIYIAGDFYESATMQGETLQAVGNSSSDVFLAKFDDAGNMAWVRTCGGTNVDVATGVDTDLENRVYVSGYYQGTTHFQNHSATCLSYNDVFLSRFDADGNCDWLSSAGSWGLDNCLGMATDWDGTTYLTGVFEEEMFADNVSFTGDGYDIYVLCYESSGAIRYGRSAGAGSSDFGMAACLGPDQSLYITGYYFYFSDFDQTTIGPADHGDCFLARMSGIMSVDEAASEKGNCLAFDPFQNVINTNCVERGTWNLTDLLGREIASGSFQNGEIQLPMVSSGMYLANVFGETSRLSIPVLMGNMQ
ncbi:MAG: hypothetical protein GC178_17960 [Flavobacteriales bacterium]|nr:hypothetical protein [Flavobacteriales bacterium]